MSKSLDFHIQSHHRWESKGFDNEVLKMILNWKVSNRVDNSFQLPKHEDNYIKQILADNPSFCSVYCKMHILLRIFVTGDPLMRPSVKSWIIVFHTCIITFFLVNGLMFFFFPINFEEIANQGIRLGDVFEVVFSMIWVFCVIPGIWFTLDFFMMNSLARKVEK